MTQTTVEQDTREDRAYRDGYLQACREWMAYENASPVFRENERRKLERRRKEMWQRDKP